MSHVDLLTNIYDEDLDKIHDLVGILLKLDAAEPEVFMYILGLKLMRLEGKQGEL